MSQHENRVKNIQNLVQNAERELRKAQSLLESLLKDSKNDFEDVPGTLGVYDGVHMVCADGKMFEVNPNYAAKSMLVVGDNLKMMEEDGKQIFKQISKVDRKKLTGILNKKEGSWYALTDSGSYKLLDAAVEFRRGQVNDEVEVLIPEGSLNVEFAALEKLAKEDNRPVIDEEKAAKHLAEKNRALGISSQAESASSVSHVEHTEHHSPKSVDTIKSPKHVASEAPEKPKAPRAATKPAGRKSDATHGGTSRGPRTESGRSGGNSGPRRADAPRRAPQDENRMSEDTQAKAASVQSILEEDDLV